MKKAGEKRGKLQQQAERQCSQHRYIQHPVFIRQRTEGGTGEGTINEGQQQIGEEQGHEDQRPHRIRIAAVVIGIYPEAQTAGCDDHSLKDAPGQLTQR